MALTPKERLNLETQVQEIQNERTNLRSKERSLKSRSLTLNSQPLVSSNGVLKENLEKIIPKHLAPKNIGHYNDVLWPFWFPFNFDFGNNPLYNSNTRQEVAVQIDQEAGFLLTHISRDHNDPGQSGYNAPLAITIRDLQSSRQFNDVSIPIQQLGFRAQPTYLDTPLFFRSNARILIEMTSWIPQGSQFQTNGSGKHQILLGGFRVRQKDASKVMASIFI